MKNNRHIIKGIAILIGILACCVGRTEAQPINYGPSDPSEESECGIYQWPEVQAPCPEVQIKQKHDHTPSKAYQSQGWDTAVTCAQQTIVLSCMPFLPVQYFNGQYTVDTIPFDPPDPTFSLGTKMPVSTDDDFAAEQTNIPFDFFFFGIRKSAFVLGANGLITFDTTATGKYCPWHYTSPIPWTNNNSGAPHSNGCTVANMRDAIYGVYEDTHPIASYLHGDQGIYYGVQDEYPCRKIICSWNGIPTFPGSRNQQNRCTYQIVCYEGSNIIEVHVKHRGVNSNWQAGRGLIGIQNATGHKQQRGEGSSRYVRDSSWAAYYPSGGNLVTTEMDSIAFRFTPVGNTQAPAHWYRIFDDGRDSIELTTDVSDTNGYYTPMGQVMSSCPTLTTAVVSPTEVSRYVFHVRFMDAADNWYNLYDTITIGVDTANSIILRPADGTADDHELDICSGEDARLMIEYPELQDTAQMTYNLVRIRNGVSTPLPDSLFVCGSLYVDQQTRTKRIPVILKGDEMSLNVQPGEIDSIEVQLIVDFVSGCHNTIPFLLRTFPAYDTTEYHGICLGDTFRWHANGQDYTRSTTTPQVNMPTSVGCDSIVHLNLTVSDVSYTIDHVNVCKPYTWINGRTYTETNTATYDLDTVHLRNQWNCDSLVQLDFTMHLMTPLIDADRDYLDFNHLDLMLNDVSIGGNGRTWYFPDGAPQTTSTAYYTAPDNIDSAIIMMVETSEYGCMDTAYLTIPFHRDVIWVPNAFIPDSEDSSTDTFHSFSNRLIKEQMYIYNRYGLLVYSCDGIDCPWDGNDFNGNPCQVGTYVYLIRYVTEYEPHVTHTLKGAVTLIK